MNIHALIQELHRKRIALSVDDQGNLRVSAEKGALSEEIRAALRSNKESLRSWLKEERNAGQAELPPLRPAPLARTYPLSFAQESLWLFEHTRKDVVAYNGAVATLVRGPIDTNRFFRAIDRVVARHEILRTGIEVQAGVPVQVIHETTPPAWELIDLSAEYRKDPTATEQRVRAEIAAEAVRKFDLQTPPLLRLRLYRLEDEHHIMLFCIHHIAYDGWSMPLLREEIRRLHEEGDSAQLPDLPIQYRDFAVWQRAVLTGEYLDSLLDYWRETLKGAEVLSLHHDFPASARGIGPSAFHREVLAATEVAPLDRLAKKTGVTLFTLLLAAFYVVLFKHTGRTDLTVGTDVAGRTRPQLERLIGFFVNQLVLRHKLDPSSTFRQLLGAVKRVTWGAFEHQDMPFSRIVQELGERRSGSGAAFFSIKLTMEHASNRSGSGWLGERMELPPGDAKLEMIWALRRHAGGIDLTVDYDSGVFAEQSVRSLVAHYRRIIAAAVAHPDTPICSLSLAGDEDEAFYRVRNQGRIATPPARSMASMLEERARQTPGAVAAVQQEKRITFSELNARSNRLARTLLAQGLAAEARVGVCMESGIDYLTCVCALSKAGAVLVPLDPSLPKMRIGQIVTDARLDLLISKGPWIEVLPGGEGKAPGVLRLDERPEEWETLDPSDFGREHHAHQLAYIVFTSGTTGKPKGVMISHHGLGSLVTAQVEQFGVRASSRVLQFASIGFDAAISEIGMALESGATLYCDERHRIMPGGPLLRFMKENEITHVTLPPVALEVMHPEPLPAVAAIVLAGEACKDEVVRRWREHVRIINAYGPSETTVCATIADLGERSGFNGSIGVPIRGTDVYMVIADGGLAPVGVPGELFIGGVSVGRGYWEDSALTAERFVPDGFSGASGARLYRTGDLARYGANGEIQFLGRVDRQVKLRGYRIEPAEVESQLLAYAQIRQAVVVVREDVRELWAYVVFEAGALDEASLRNHLRDRLPEYMVPARILPVDAIPLNVNGKVDLQRLAQTARVAVSAEPNEHALTDAEERVRAVWREVLNRSDISTRQSFFDAGGNSLLLVQVHERLQQALGVELDVADLFKYPTIESIAAFLHTGGSGPDLFGGIEERVAKRRRARMGA